MQHPHFMEYKWPTTLYVFCKTFHLEAEACWKLSGALDDTQNVEKASDDRTCTHLELQS